MKNTLAHNAKHFTQGLVFHNNRLFESTGIYGESGIHEIDPTNGRILRSRAFPRKIFAEGLTSLNDRLYQVTWLNQLGIVFDLDLNPVAQFAYAGEGWGLTDDGKQLVMSDGSSKLKWIDPKSIGVTRVLEVTDRGKPVTQLNELEYAKGLIYANVWLTDRIAVISPKNGRVMHWLDLSSLKMKFKKPADWNETENVLNGIAYNDKRETFLVTGKRWPVMYELKITDR